MDSKLDADLNASSVADETISKEMGHWDSAVIRAQEVVVRGDRLLSYLDILR